jgi:DedD protein
LDEHSFKQRLVGAIVLVALAVIFIPMLLPGHRELGFDNGGSAIPPKPAELENLQVLELEKPQPAPAPREIVRTPIDERSPETPPPADDRSGSEEQTPLAEATPPPPATKSDKSTATPPKAWAVQVGSFTQRDNAMKLRDKLRSKGYQSFVEQITSAGKTFYRVRVGPEISRDKAEALQKDLQTKMKLQASTVVPHP